MRQLVTEGHIYVAPKELVTKVGGPAGRAARDGDLCSRGAPLPPPGRPGRLPRLHSEQRPPRAAPTTAVQHQLRVQPAAAAAEGAGWQQRPHPAGGLSALPAARLQALKDTPSRLSFTNVVAMRANGAFAMGEPYLGDAFVEAELLDEFLGPIASASHGAVASDAAAPTAAAPQQLPASAAALESAMMARFRVTRIRGPAGSGGDGGAAQQP